MNTRFLNTRLLATVAATATLSFAGIAHAGHGIAPEKTRPGGSSWVYKVLATNDLGMHCVDADFSVFSILPPYNVVNAQVVRRSGTGRPVVVNDSVVTLRYEAVRDTNGSINSTSRRSKTNFWSFAAQTYGASLAYGQGLKGLYMPADAPTVAQRSFAWDTGSALFRAEGVPIVPVDDAGNVNRYPLMRVVAVDRATGRTVASTDVVLPVSEETTCANCHATGASAASDTAVTWSAKTDLEIQSRENVLLLHDHNNGTRLFASKPVLCASCHYSPALDLAGAGPNSTQSDHELMSAVMHDFHADKMRSPSGAALPDHWLTQGQQPPAAESQSCYQCHPGKSTQCLRGAMTDAVTCQNCHGGMKSVGGNTRRPWVDLPRCQSCHTGDATDHVTLEPSLMATDGIRALLAFSPDDPSATPFLATNKRFAENDGKLYRYSKGHSGIACEGCHNSTHAIWPNPVDLHNDNVAAKQLQGHSGTISECSTCHAAGSLPLTLRGPHGMHNVADSRWTTSHKSLAESNLPACAACHGADFRGTALSRTAAVRTWSTEYGTRTVPKGQAVGCYDCHNGPHDD